MPADQLAVEPGGGIGADLAVEIDRRVNLDEELATLALVVGGRLLQEVLGNLPIVGIQALDDARPAQGFEAPHVRFQVTLDIAAGNALGAPGDLGMLGALVEPVVARCERGDGLVHRTGRGLPANAEDGPDPDFVRHQGRIQLDVVHATVHPVDDEVDLVRQPVAGETLGPDMAGDGRSRQLTVDREVRHRPLGSLLAQRVPHDGDGVDALAQALEGGLDLGDSCHTPGSTGSASSMASSFCRRAAKP